MALDPPLSRLGLGTWAYGRTGWGQQDDRDSRAAILRAVELGVNWIDTAAVYGDGHAERLLGAVLHELPASERPLVFTKAGVHIDRAVGTTFRELSPGSLREECEASLARLGVERIDLLQLHWPVPDSAAVAEAWSTLAELRDEGKIRWAGVSNFDARLLDSCSVIAPVDAVQLPLSLLSREAVAELLPWASEHGALALAYSPLESELLSGRFSTGRVSALAAGDRRGEREQFREPRLARSLALVDRLTPLAAELEASLAELAIAWTLAWPGLSGAIVGARDAAQVDGWVRAPAVALDAAMLAQIGMALSDTGAGSGPLDPGVIMRGSAPLTHGPAAPRRPRD